MRLVAQDRIENANGIVWAIFWRSWLLTVLLMIPVGGTLQVMLNIGISLAGVQASGVVASFPLLEWIVQLVAYAVATYFAIKLTLRGIHGKNFGSSAFLLARVQDSGPIIAKDADVGDISWEMTWRYAALTALLDSAFAAAWALHDARLFSEAALESESSIAFFVSLLLLFPVHFAILKWIVRSQHQKNIGGSTYLIATVYNDEAASHAN